MKDLLKGTNVVIGMCLKPEELEEYRQRFLQDYEKKDAQALEQFFAKILLFRNLEIEEQKKKMKKMQKKIEKLAQMNLPFPL